MRIRQIALVAEKLAPAEAALTDVLGINVAYRDPGVGKYGLENAVMVIGDTFLEVVAPIQENTTAGRFLERRGGDGGYMVILQVADVEAARRHVRDLGIRIVESLDGPRAWATHLHPKDVPGAILSIDAMDPPESWLWAGREWQGAVRTDRSKGIVAAEIQAGDPAALAARWAEVLERPAADLAGTPTITLDDGTAIRFVPISDGRPEGLAAIDVAMADRGAALAAANAAGMPVAGDTVTICGTRINLV